MGSMNTKMLSIVISAATVLGTVVMLRTSPNQRHRQPAMLLEAFDTSSGYRPHLGDAALRGARLAARFDPDCDRVVLFRVDSESAAFYDNAAPVSSDSLLETMNRELKPLPRRNGTYTAAFFSDVTRRAAASSQNVVIVYLSDADNDDTSNAADRALCKSGKDLAGNPRVRAVIFADVSSANRSAIERQFGALGDRLHVFGITDSDGASLCDVCEKALNGSHP